ncbi:D-alanyl-D-alanine carboxypeptidase/D-alanyl-D-alanine-endopeptidase [Janibacter melonis]|uniref:D-alanyl-D-alanine carboxypeptidase/D-alanyl-D-alanine endopeptidase n=1 Tax=Janibacter melonis TaxID=262209 RepID=UPI001E388D76|nr:D-alanyl-D-alanine carboxypeptidase/D-alanyl-D-alanine-endopeptidase [Janibacter melonis]MCB5991004.1 D-alanyl-D-alanine carboxypeptidase/D-alanyl-D-alanine-endopeptidase [Janibacter melonis]
MRHPRRTATTTTLLTAAGLVAALGLAAPATADPAPARVPAQATTPPDPGGSGEHSETTTGVVPPFVAPSHTGPARSVDGTARSTAGLPASGLPTRLSSRSTSFGSSFSGSVFDTSSGSRIWSKQATKALRPGSTMKLLTATTALRTFGTRHRFVTPVLRAGSRGDYVYLKGVGDPTVSSYRLDQMAASTAYQLKKRGIRSISLRVDDTLFPAPRNATGWEASDVGQWVTPVRALVYDGRMVSDTSMDAGDRFRSELRSRGISVRDLRRGATASGAQQIASGRSPELRTIVGDMLRVSHNDYAEKLLWASGMKAGTSRTWAGVTSYSRSQVAGYGVSTYGSVIADGSGLSRSDRLTSHTLAQLVLALRKHPSLGPVIFADASLPIAGRTGTLQNRFETAPASCAVGRVRAKTGSLRDAGAMAGIAKGTDGKERVFAVVSNGQPYDADLRGRIDALVATTTLCM